MWRAMNSLLVLRDQVNAFAPNRLRGSDGLVGDAAHQATISDHNPHDVDGVGRDIVTALDLTHDPAGGFDSYRFAETLRRNRDRRIKYVISNGRMFSSYATSSYAPFAWRPYSGADQHKGHVHVSVLDAVISDTGTPWNLDGLGDNVSKAEVLDALDDQVAYTSQTVAKWAAANGWGPVSTRALAEYTMRATQDTEKAVEALGAKVDGLVVPSPAPVDAAVLKAALLDPEVLAAIAKAVNDDDHRRSAE